MKPIINIKGLFKSYGANQVLKGFDLQLNEGENLVVMGKSGSGKSVMIKCIVGLEDYDAGSIEVMGKEIKFLSDEELNKIRLEIGFLFQGSALYDSMSVRENLEFPLRRHREKFGNIVNTETQVLEALTNVGLAHTIDMMPEELSGGMKRRVALARTLILQPKVILYDEPTTGLDPQTAKEIVALMHSIREKYKTASIVITHDINCAKAIGDRIVLLVDGINYAQGSFEQLEISNDKRVQAFFK
ncbi:ABC transporter ATP-binding protein [Flavobacterium terrisoli]|uniref:ABC transporter ATP-binding protein n=1 Tax=Flavobacterium terrisoli TaxID=3242195 RepID=UPI002542DD5B|nr:ATP-binding cassette domain-containing protein [Flavobacterium buctense]